MSNQLETNYPDIEIYLHNTSVGEILTWLQSIYTDIELVKTRHDGKSQNIIARNMGDDQQIRIPILIIENARDNFTCVWFQSGNTPWPTDIECARCAASHFTVEVRCSTGPWSEEKPSGEAKLSDEWFSLRGNRESTIHW